ncbi:hypothetical protein ABEB36_010587 [Hypothenemus hampei]|uniref:Uncharacterized protein n=1 Tax=Hypothenemus hampei TaxID=57062 RepID=A0ABD1EGQ6_HYPHA
MLGDLFAIDNRKLFQSFESEFSKCGITFRKGQLPVVLKSYVLAWSSLIEHEEFQFPALHLSLCVTQCSIRRIVDKNLWIIQWVFQYSANDELITEDQIRRKKMPPETIGLWSLLACKMERIFRFHNETTSKKLKVFVIELVLKEDCAVEVSSRKITDLSLKCGFRAAQFTFVPKNTQWNDKD